MNENLAHNRATGDHGQAQAKEPLQPDPPKELLDINQNPAAQNHHAQYHQNHNQNNNHQNQHQESNEGTGYQMPHQFHHQLPPAFGHYINYGVQPNYYNPHVSGHYYPTNYDQNHLQTPSLKTAYTPMYSEQTTEDHSQNPSQPQEATQNPRQDKDLNAKDSQEDTKVLHIDLSFTGRGCKTPNRKCDINIHDIADYLEQDVGTVRKIIKYEPKNKGHRGRPGEGPPFRGGYNRKHEAKHQVLVEFDTSLNAKIVKDKYNGKVMKEHDVILRIEDSVNYKKELSFTEMNMKKDLGEENCWDYEKKPRPTKAERKRRPGSEMMAHGHPRDAFQTPSFGPRNGYRSGDNGQINSPIYGRQNGHNSLYQGVDMNMPWPQYMMTQEFYHRMCMNGLLGFPQSGPGTYGNNGYHLSGYHPASNHYMNGQQLVVSVENLNKSHPRFAGHVKDDLFKLFGHYGDVKKLKICHKTHYTTALIEYECDRNGTHNANDILDGKVFYGQEIKVRKNGIPGTVSEPKHGLNMDRCEIEGGSFKSFDEKVDNHRYKKENGNFNRSVSNKMNNQGKDYQQSNQPHQRSQTGYANSANQSIQPNKIVHISNIPVDFDPRELFAPNVDLEQFPIVKPENVQELKNNLFNHQIKLFTQDSYDYLGNFKWHKPGGTRNLGQSSSSTGLNGHAAANAEAGIGKSPAAQPEAPTAEKADAGSASASASTNAAAGTSASNPDLRANSTSSPSAKMAYVHLPTTEDAIMFLILIHNFQVRETKHLRASFSKKTDWEKIQSE